MQKNCAKCNQVKPFDSFYKQKANKDGHQRYCKTCSKQSNSAWYEASADKIILDVDTKTCSYCKEIKKVLEFNKQKKSKDGLQSRCKKCSNATRKDWEAAHPTWAKDNYAALSEEKKKTLNQQSKNWREANPEKCKQGYKKWRNSNKEKHYQQSKKSRKKQYHNNLHVRIKMALRTRLYQALKGINKSDTALNLLGCTIEEFKIYIEKIFVEGMTWENHGKWHLDHIKPCAKFDLLNEEQQKECFHFTNLQPLWAEENINKRDRIDWVSISIC